ncbi:MAG: glycine cleavage T C-terminal barrel domain-containing protein [Verrucomicrobiota bacterium]
MSDHIDLSNRTKLRLSGADRLRYLNGQVSNQVQKATSEAAIYACVTTAKGKMEADVFIAPIPDEDAFLIDGPPELREELMMRLDRYIIADDCELEDVTDDFELVHVLGNNPPRLEGAWLRAANRIGTEAVDLIAPKGTDLAGKLGSKAADPDRIEELRIANGIAKWGTELSSEVLPQEARLQDRAIDFQKGCYVGQEMISRIKSAGRVKQELVTLAATAEGKSASIQTGAELQADGEKIIGRVTSAVYSAILGRWIALGFVRREHLEIGTQLKVSCPENNHASVLEISDFSGM